MVGQNVLHPCRDRSFLRVGIVVDYRRTEKLGTCK